MKPQCLQYSWPAISKIIRSHLKTNVRCAMKVAIKFLEKQGI